MNKLIERFAEIQGVTYEEAEEKIGAETDEEILKNIEKITTEIINSKTAPKLNRAQRRSLKKKMGAKKYEEWIAENGTAADAIAETTKKLDYIDLIQKLRALNEKNEKEIKENENLIENN